MAMMSKNQNKREIVERMVSIVQQGRAQAGTGSTPAEGKQVEDARRALREERRLTPQKLERTASV
jgi:hypothetical protein